MRAANSSARPPQERRPPSKQAARLQSNTGDDRRMGNRSRVEIQHEIPLVMPGLEQLQLQ